MSSFYIPEKNEQQQSSMTMNKSTNVFYQNHRVSRDKRAESLSNGRQFRGCTVWFTGIYFINIIIKFITIKNFRFENRKFGQFFLLIIHSY